MLDNSAQNQDSSAEKSNLSHSKVPSSFDAFQSEKDEGKLPLPFTLPYDVVVESLVDETLDSRLESVEEIEGLKFLQQDIISNEASKEASREEEHLLTDKIASGTVNDITSEVTSYSANDIRENISRKNVSSGAMEEDIDFSHNTMVHSNKKHISENNDKSHLYENSTYEKFSESLTDNSSHELYEVDVSTKKSGEALLGIPFENDFNFDSNIDSSFGFNSEPPFQAEEYELNEISLDDLENHYAEITKLSEVPMPFSEDAHGAVFPPHAQDLFLGQNRETDELEYEEIDWDAFVEYCISHEFPEEYIPYIRLSSAKLRGDECLLRISSDCALHQLNVVQKEVGNFLVDFLGKTVKIRYAVDAYERRTVAEMMEAMYEHPQIKMLQKEFSASLLRCSDLKPGYKDKRRES